MLKYLIEKELKQLMRNSFLPRFIVIYPIILLTIMPWVATLEIKDLRLAVIDNDRSTTSRQLIHRIEASGYFQLTETPASYEEGLKSMEKGHTDIILEIPDGFEKEKTIHRPSHVLIAANAVNGTKGGLGSSYLTQIVNNASDGYSVRYRFNPHLDYKLFMIPALMGLVLVIFCGFLPALNIVGEKENGTIEQMNVTPVRKVTFTFAKLLPYWLTGIVVLSSMMLIAWLMYGITPAGSLPTIYLGCFTFIIVISGLGLVISNYSNTLQQAMFVMWFFMLIMILMSGLFTPVGSMPGWAQVITGFNPLKYLMEIMRMVYLKGSAIHEISGQLFILIGFALFFNTWAIVSYKKKR